MVALCALPMFLAGRQLWISAVPIVVVVAEMNFAHSGLSAAIWLSWQTLRTEVLYAYLFVITVFGLCLNGALTLMAQTLIPWRGRQSR